MTLEYFSKNLRSCVSLLVLYTTADDICLTAGYLLVVKIEHANIICMRFYRSEFEFYHYLQFA